MEEDSIEQNYRLMDAMQKELRLRGLEFNLARLMPNTLDRKLLQCRPLYPDDRKPMFNLEFGLDDQYTDVVGRVADKLHMDPARIRLARHICPTNEPDYADLEYPFDCLKDILERPVGTLCDILYYDVLDGRMLRNSKNVEVPYGGYPNAQQSQIGVQPDHISVEALPNDKEVVKPRLVVGTICKDFSPEEKI